MRTINDSCQVVRTKVNERALCTAACTGMLVVCLTAPAALAQSPPENNQKDFVREFSNGKKEFIKEFGFDNFDRKTGQSKEGTDNGSEVDEMTAEERARQLEVAFHKKLAVAKLPGSFEIAVKYHHSGDLEKAIPFYKKVLEEDPKHESARNNLALCLSERKAEGDIEAAKELLEQSQKLSDADPSATRSPTQAGDSIQENPQKKIVSAQLFVQGQLSEQSGDLSKATEYYQRALEQQRPVDQIIVRHLSDLYIKMGNYSAARAVLKRGILAAPPEDQMKVLYQAITNLDNKEKSNKKVE